MKKKIIISTVCAVLLCCALVAIALLCNNKPDGHLVILHVNDTHSHFEPVAMNDDGTVLLGGVIERAAYIDSVRKADGAENVLLLHAGDFSQGTSYFSELGGDIEIATINAMGYDAVALGNHEFDNGLEDLARRLSQINCPVVCANYDFSTFEAGKYITPYTIVEKAGLKIGITGVICDLSEMIDRDTADRLPFLDQAESVNKWAKYLKEEEHCDLVIALNHIGYELEPYTDPMMVADTRNVDFVIGGHSHTFLEKMESALNLDGEEVPIVQDGCWGEYVGRIDVRKK